MIINSYVHKNKFYQLEYKKLVTPYKKNYDDIIKTVTNCYTFT